MEHQPSSAPAATGCSRAEVDTSRPFRSVKEAVAVFGERILSDEAYSKKTTMKHSIHHPPPPNPKHYSMPPPPPPPTKPLYSATSSPPSYSSSSSHFNHDSEDNVMIMASLKKLESELEDTKRELAFLKKRESETEILVASLNAELHNSMLRLAEMEALGSAKAGAKSTSDIEEVSDRIASERWGDERHGGDHVISAASGLKYLPSLAQVMRLGEMEGRYGGGGRKRKVGKKKPIIPLVMEIFPRRKVHDDDHGSFYSRSYNYSVSS